MQNACDIVTTFDNEHLIYQTWGFSEIISPSHFRAAFTHVAPKSQVKISIFFTLFGSKRAKAGRKMLMKLTP